MKENELNKLKEKRNNLFIGVIGSIITTISCLPVIVISPSIGLGVASLATSIGCLCYKNTKKLNETEKRLIQEQEHKNMIVEETEESKRVKADMLIDSIGLRKRSEKSLENAKTISIFTYLVAFVGALNTFINPSNLWLSVLGIGCSVIAGYYELNKHKTNEIIRNRIHNLNYDLEVAEQEKEKQEKDIIEKVLVNNYSINNEKENTKQKVYVKKR